MKQNKLAILILVIAAVLFVLGLSSGFFLHTDEKNNDLSMSKAQELKSSWIGSLGDLMSPFRNSLDIRRIKNRPECQIGDGIYKLTGSLDSCVIIISGKKGATVEEANLSIKEDNVKILVPFPDAELCPTATRGSGISFGKLKDSRVITEIGRVRPGFGRPGVAEKSPELSVVYVPSGGEDQTAKCEIKKVGLMVLEEGGVLKLKCNGCSNNQTVTVTLK
jgi:hypothetical protein